MSKDRGALEQLGEELKQLRDELEVQLHLASADARDEFAELESKLDRFRGKMDVVGKTAGEAAEDVGDAIDLLGQEIKKGYQKIRSLL